MPTQTTELPKELPKEPLKELPKEPSIELPDPLTMDRKDRQMEIIKLRNMVTSQDNNLSPEQLRRGLELIRAERIARTGRVPKYNSGSGSGSRTKGSKKVVEQFELDDFLD